MTLVAVSSHQPVFAAASWVAQQAHMAGSATMLDLMAVRVADPRVAHLLHSHRRRALRMYEGYLDAGFESGVAASATLWELACSRDRAPRAIKRAMLLAYLDGRMPAMHIALQPALAGRYGQHLQELVHMGVFISDYQLRRWTDPASDDPRQRASISGSFLAPNADAALRVFLALPPRMCSYMLHVGGHLHITGSGGWARVGGKWHLHLAGDDGALDACIPDAQAPDCFDAFVAMAGEARGSRRAITRRSSADCKLTAVPDDPFGIGASAPHDAVLIDFQVWESEWPGAGAEEDEQPLLTQLLLEAAQSSQLVI